MNTNRNAALDRLAMGSNCPACGASADEPCITRYARKATAPHSARIDRACKSHEAMQAIKNRLS